MPIAYANQTFFHKALPLITFMTRQLLGLNENHLNQPVCICGYMANTCLSCIQQSRWKYTHTYLDMMFNDVQKTIN